MYVPPYSELDVAEKKSVHEDMARPAKANRYNLFEALYIIRLPNDLSIGQDFTSSVLHDSYGLEVDSIVQAIMTSQVQQEKVRNECKDVGNADGSLVFPCSKIESARGEKVSRDSDIGTGTENENDKLRTSKDISCEEMQGCTCCMANNDDVGGAAKAGSIGLDTNRCRYLMTKAKIDIALDCGCSCSNEAHSTTKPKMKTERIVKERIMEKNAILYDTIETLCNKSESSFWFNPNAPEFVPSRIMPQNSEVDTVSERGSGSLEDDRNERMVHSDHGKNGRVELSRAGDDISRPCWADTPIYMWGSFAHGPHTPPCYLYSDGFWDEDSTALQSVGSTLVFYPFLWVEFMCLPMYWWFMGKDTAQEGARVQGRRGGRRRGRKRNRQRGRGCGRDL